MQALIKKSEAWNVTRPMFPPPNPVKMCVRVPPRDDKGQICHKQTQITAALFLTTWSENGLHVAGLSSKNTNFCNYPGISTSLSTAKK